ncbi:hypothetical protein L3X38_027754 [Prunus dulcis]|uniref:Uncharacterized protein n=1 Tax=Prunus dulcis TaxID=3755 RepID=A0AAD4YZS2_PRUDU|nr:hypothetical protein L3X38_027754 [Prunus dulcis]
MGFYVRWVNLVMNLVHTVQFSLDFEWGARGNTQNCRHMRLLLDGYCRAFGQQINFGKSSLFFSPNTPASIRTQLGAILGMTMVDDPEPNSLWARLIKALYFPECNFMEATKGSRASWAWASLIEGRKVILNGARWLIMNGAQARIWTDNWITNIQRGALWPAPGAFMDRNSTVETIID